jgi:hypothetical protein
VAEGEEEAERVETGVLGDEDNEGKASALATGGRDRAAINSGRTGELGKLREKEICSPTRCCGAGYKNRYTQIKKRKEK